MRIKSTLVLILFSILSFGQTWLQPEYDNLGVKLNLTVGDGTGNDSLIGIGRIQYYLKTQGAFIRDSMNGGLAALELGTNLFGAGLEGVTIFTTLGDESSYFHANNNGSNGVEATMAYFNSATGRLNEVYVFDSTIAITLDSELAGIILSDQNLTHPHIKFALNDPDAVQTYNLELHHHDGNFIFENDSTGFKFTAPDSFIVDAGVTKITGLAGSGSGLVAVDNSGVLGFAAGMTGWIIDGNDNMYAGTTYSGAGNNNTIAGLATAGSIISSGAAGNTIFGQLNETDTTNFPDPLGSTIFGFQNNGIGDFCVVTGYTNTLSNCNKLLVYGGGNTITGSGGNGVIIGSEYALSISTSNQFYLQGEDYHLGMGDGIPIDVTIGLSPETGTNTAASTLTVKSGSGTGNSTSGGNMAFQTSDAGASGSTEQTFTTKFEITKSGVFICPTMPTDSTGLPSGSLWSNSGIIQIKP